MNDERPEARALNPRSTPPAVYFARLKAEQAEPSDVVPCLMWRRGARFPCGKPAGHPGGHE